MTDIDILINKVRDDRSLLEYIALFVPKYRGYKEKDLRRDIDALIREKLHSSLHTNIMNLRWAQKELINSNLFSLGNQVEASIIQTDIISKKALHAKQGYSAVWQAIKTGKEELTEVVMYDASLLEKSKEMGELTSKMKVLMNKKDFEGFEQNITEYDQFLTIFDELFNGREEIIFGLANNGENI